MPITWSVLPFIFSGEVNRRIDFYQEHTALTTQTDTQAANGVSLPLDLTVGHNATSCQNVRTNNARAHYVTSGHNATPDPNAESYHNGPYEVLSRDVLEQTIHHEMTQGELFYTEDEKISLCLEYTSRLEYSLGNTRGK